MNINDLPPEIAALARKRQQEERNPGYNSTTNELARAFYWGPDDDPDSEFKIWNNAYIGNYDDFYARYGRPSYVHPNDGLVEEPVKEWVPKVGERVSVSNNNEDWHEAIYVAEKDGMTIACIQVGIDHFEKGRLFTSGWYNHVRRLIPTPRRITRAEIAKAMNIEGDNFEIVD